MADQTPDMKLTPRVQIAESEAMDRLARHRAIPHKPPATRLSKSVSKMARRLLKDEAPGIELLKTRWKDLVGERLSKVSTPQKLTGKKGELVLTLEILPAAAPLFQHHGEALRQKLSVQLGGGLKSIRMVHKADAGRTVTRPGAMPLPLQDVKALETPLTDIKNKQLAQALLAFGKAVYTRDR